MSFPGKYDRIWRVRCLSWIFDTWVRYFNTNSSAKDSVSFIICHELQFVNSFGWKKFPWSISSQSATVECIVTFLNIFITLKTILNSLIWQTPDICPFTSFSKRSCQEPTACFFKTHWRQVLQLVQHGCLFFFKLSN